MDELKDASIHHTAIKLSNDIKTMKLYDDLFKRVQGLVCQPSVDKNDLRNSLEDAIKNAGLDTEFRNIIYHLVRTSTKNDSSSSNFVSFVTRKELSIIENLLSREIHWLICEGLVSNGIDEYASP